MSKEPRILTTDILESIEKIETYAMPAGRESFLKDGEAQDAVIRRLAIIGEAAKNMPLELKRKHPNIPWKKITGMRNILIHEYSEVDVERVWDTVQREIPALKKEILIIQAELG